MRRFLGWLVLLVTTGACTPPQGPTPEKTASYLGLSDGREMTYQVNDSATGTPTTARINISRDSSFADYLSFKTDERDGGGFPSETITYGTTAEDMRLLRLGDCLPSCTDFTSPPVLIRNPVVANQSYESVSGTRVQGTGSPSEGPSERHVITVGAESNLVTPSGTFRAYPVSWRRFVGGSTTSEDRTFYFAPDKGMVGMDRATKQYRVQGGVSP
jgi:hypothetical protein